MIENAKIEGSWNERLILILLSCVQFIVVLDFVIMMPLGPHFMRSFDITPSQFGLMVSIYTWAGAVVGLMGVAFMDRFDRRRALIACFLGFNLGTLLCAIAPSHTFFIGARALAGVFGALIGSIVFAIIGDVFPEERRGRATGIVMSAFSIASVLGLPIGLWLANESGWHIPFFVLVVLGVLVWALAFFALPSLRSHLERGLRSSLHAQLAQVFGQAHQRWALLSTVLTNFAQFSIIPYITVYFTANVGFPEASIPLVYLVGGAATFFASRFIGRWADRIGKAQVFTRVALFSLFPMLGLTHLPPSPPWGVLLVSTLFMMSISGRMVALVALVTGSVPPRIRGRFMSVNQSVQAFASGTAAYLAGLMIVKLPDGRIAGYERVGYLGVLVSLMAIGSVWQVVRKNDRA